MLSPIGLSTYKRLNHVKRTIESLQKNTLAIESELYIFSDGPKSGDEEDVFNVREYLKTVNGFKKVEIVERNVNLGMDDNSKWAMQSVLDRYGRFIWLEEDCVTAPAFIQFMNAALETYEHDQRIISISGYCPPIKIPEDYPYDVFLLPRFSAWGFGIWKDKYELVERVLPKEEVNALFNSWEEKCNFGIGGLDMLNKLKRELEKPHAHDVRIFFRQYQLQMDTVYPVGSLVKNVGLDGSGTHSPKSNFKDVTLRTAEKSRFLPPKIERDQRIIRSHFLFRLRKQKWYLTPRILPQLIPFMIYRLARGKSIIP